MGVPAGRGETSPRDGEGRAGLTRFVVVLLQAGDVSAPHRQDGVDGDGQGACGVPGSGQRHLEVHPGLAQRDEAEDHHPSQAQQQAQLAADLPGLVQQPPAQGQLRLPALVHIRKPAAERPPPGSALRPTTPGACCQTPSHPA